eukprot:CAMPEP_0176318624 /NCGR_PEP_ID=MMETSP0121_2-20121125/69874_1 /TAXON_ID=160619 /ORGANISM="Kryptoperidinium foliaceum, Strain CCMP 1326" /LENGTH=54 /DNA_ID=CAMNT_0017660931 /DNA_START=206 /DNA_END=367 /DNA_ORIENTATION=-
MRDRRKESRAGLFEGRLLPPGVLAPVIWGLQNISCDTCWPMATVKRAAGAESSV